MRSGRLAKGAPFIHMPSAAFNPTYRSWQTPEGRHWYERLARNRRVVRYDSRGFGESQHGVATFSLDSMVRRLAAVVDRFDQKRVALFGYLASGPVAIAYAAAHPERVSHIILWCSSSSGADFVRSDREDVFAELRSKDWEFYTETLALQTFGWEAPDQARHYAAALRDTVTPEALDAVLAAMLRIDVSEHLSSVASPTLVLHRRDFTRPNVDASRRLASHIPNAQLTVLDGDSVMPYGGDAEAVLQAIEGFLDTDEQTETASGQPAGLATILFTDMESSTALTQRLGDARAQELVRAHNSIAIQQAIEGRAEAPLRVRIGLNAGEPVAEEDDLFGASVQLAKSDLVRGRYEVSG